MATEQNFIQKVAPHVGARFSKFGMAELANQILNLAFKKGNFGHSDRRIYQRKLEDFFSNMETDLLAILKNQKLFLSFMKDTMLINFLLTQKYPSVNDYDERSGDEYSRLNDQVALSAVEYLQKIFQLTAKKPAYKVFNKKILEYMQLPWFKQMEMLVDNSKKYATYNIQASIDIKFSREYPNEKRYKISTDQFVLKFVAKNLSVPMFNRMSGTIELIKEKRQFQLNYIDIDQETATVDNSTWATLIKKVLNNDTRLLLELKRPDQKLNMDFDLVIHADSGTTHAIARVNNGRARKFSYIAVPNKYGNSLEWVNGTKEMFSQKTKGSLPNYIERINGLKNDHLYSRSRKFIYSYRENFKELFSSLDELVLLAAIANFYRENEGKWVMPKMKPMDSMLIDIKGGLNPLFFQKGAGVSIPNDFRLDEKTTGFLITGANTGGKTAYTNMYALNQMLAQAGLPVFASSATMATKDRIFCHYVESDDIGVNLSRYQSELHRLHQIIEEMTKYSVVLFDEPFSGTSVESGAHQAYEVLKTFTKVKCACIMNTHLHPLVGIVGNNETSGISQKHFLLPNPENPLPTDYKVQLGGITASYGELIAQVEKVDHKSMMKILKKRKVVKSIR